MEKEKFNIEGLYRIEQNELSKCADVAARAFLDDESSKFLLSSKLTYKSLYDYYLTIYKVVYNKMHIFAESKDINGFIIVSPLKNADLSLWDYIRAKSLKAIFSFGIGVILRSLKFENNCIKIRNKIASLDSWYIFQFGVLPSKQGQGVGSKTMKPFLKWLDTQKIPCYLETQKIGNIHMYKHFGFTLESIDTLAQTTKNQFAMLRTQAKSY